MQGTEMSKMVTCGKIGESLIKWIEKADEEEVEELCEALDDCTSDLENASLELKSDGDVEFTDNEGNTSTVFNIEVEHEDSDLIELSGKGTEDDPLKATFDDSEPVPIKVEDSEHADKADDADKLSGLEIDDILESDVTTNLSQDQYSDGDIKQGAYGDEGEPMDFDELDIRYLPVGIYAVNAAVKSSGADKLDDNDGDTSELDDDDFKSSKGHIKGDMVDDDDLKWRGDPTSSSGKKFYQILDVKYGRHASSGKLDRPYIEGTRRNKKASLTQRAYKVMRGSTFTRWIEYWTDANAKPDSDGFLVESSPFLRVFTDSIKTEDVDAELELEHEDTGVYKIANTSGLHSTGWQISTPTDPNGNKYLFVECDCDDDGNIELRTFEPKFENGQNVGGDAVDIPEGQHVVLRLNDEPDDEDDEDD